MFERGFKRASVFGLIYNFKTNPNMVALY